MSSQPNRPLADFTTDRRVLVLSLMAVFVGCLSAFLALGLVDLINGITNLALYGRLSVKAAEASGNPLGPWVIAVPAAGGLLIGLMARYGSEKIRGHGIPEALEAIIIGRSRMDPKVAVLKPVSSAISIGTGGPFGAEGPIIMTGGAFGSLFAQMFRLTSAERKTLLVAGAAGGMAAIFSAPVASILLAVELLLLEWKPRSFIPVAFAASAAALVRRPLLGEGPIFPDVPHAAFGALGLGFAVIVGLIAGFGSGLLTVLVYVCEDAFAKLRLHWMWWPAIGGLAVGIGGWLEPRALGVGYETIHGLIRGDVVLKSLFLFVTVKATIWAISLGSGTSGGVLAPLLLIGGALGAILSGVIPVGNPSAWALVGMAAMMGGTMRAPFTAAVFAVELTNDFALLPALILAAASAQMVTVLIMKRSILTEKLARRGRHFVREYSVDLFESALVADVMDGSIPWVAPTTTVLELSNRIAAGDPAVAGRQAVFIVDEGNRLRGLITRGDIMRVLGSGDQARVTVLDAGAHDLVVTYPDEPLTVAVERMLDHNIGRLPVVDRSNPAVPVGYIGRADVLAARRRLHAEEHVRERLLGFSVNRSARSSS